MTPVAPSPIRQAATVVLLRDSGGSPEVLLVQRNRGAAFMADAHVFPGGRLEEGDAGDYALAAARETFEEAGVLLATDERGDSPDLRDAPWLEGSRHAVQKGDIGFVAFLLERGLRFDPEQLIYFARWITPPTESRRFDARFFLARVPAHQEGAPDPAGEVSDSHWATPARFLALQAAGEIKLPPPTLWHLADLAAHATVESALAWARSRTLITVRPKLAPWRGKVSIVLPWDPEYDQVPVEEGEAIAPDHPVVTQATTRFVLDADLWRPVDARRPA